LWGALLAILVLAGVVPASALESSGAVAWGKNNDGQLGNGTTTTEKEAVAVKVLTEAMAVAAGELHSVALLKNGKVMAWGYNADGQLGNGTTTNAKEPVEVKGLSEVVAIAAGADHSLALLKSGKVKAWGYNNDGQLGNGTTTTEKEPVEVKGLTEVVAIAAGADHSLAVLKSGKVKAWGDNNDGQLGNGTTTNAKEPVEVKGLSEATAVAGGEFHSVALLASGKVEAWGYNNDGQLGNGTTTTEKEPVEVKSLSEATAIAAGHSHSLAVLKSGKVKAWGDNNDGQLGNGTTTNAKEPVEVKGLSEATAVAGGEFHSVALLKSGKVNAWGYNSEGQLGNGTTTTEKEPVEAKGVSHIGGIAAGADFSLASYAIVPANTALPAISGEAKDEKTLSATTGTWTGSPTITYSYQWQSCNIAGESCSSISGATAATYTISHEQVGHTIEVKVTASNAGGEASASSTQTATVAASVPANTALPAISGEAKDEKTLSATAGTWTGSPTITYTYEWQSCNSKGESCSNISGATSTTYKLTSSNVGGTVRVEVTAKNVVKSTSAFSAVTSVVAGTPPENTALPTISGKAEERQRLTASTGTWTGTEPITYAYQWQSCNSKGESCSNISGATSTTYKLTSSNVGGTVRVEVTAKNVVKSTSAFSAVTSVVTAGPPEYAALPAISGTAESGQLLTVSNGSWEGTPPVSYAYQWESCSSNGESCSNISGATASSYRVLNSQVGDTLRAVVTASNSAGSGKATSEATAAITTGPPVNTELPAISGTAKAGETLSASTGAWAGGEPLSYTYQWESCNSSGESCSNISGATSSTYQLTASIVGRTLRIVVTGKNAVSATETTSSATSVVMAPPSNTALPTTSGTVRDGLTLSTNVGTWSGSTPMTYSYQWQSCNPLGEECQNIEGASTQTFTPDSGDQARTLRVVVTATNGDGLSAASSAATVQVQAGPPSQLEAPSIAGLALVGQTLQGDAGTWGGTETELAYQWERCDSAGRECVDIAGATELQYIPSEIETGARLRLRVGASNALGSLTALSPATSVVGAASSLENTNVPSVSGVPKVGQTLSAASGSWLGNDTIGYSYTWQRCSLEGDVCANVEGATSPEYTAQAADVGSQLRVLVQASDSVDGNVAQPSPETEPVAAANAPVSEAPPAMTGSGLPGNTLATDAGSWNGEVTDAYRWERCNEYGEGCSPIAGAESNSYLLGAGDAGTTVRALLTATGAGGSSEAPSGALTVSPSVPGNVAAPSISDTNELGQTLRADAGLWTGAGALAFSYQWKACNEEGTDCAPIDGATEASYKPSAADVAKTIIVTVTASSSFGSASASSAPTYSIGEEPIPPLDIIAPSIEGSATAGETLTATPGVWSGSEPISYSYEWALCSPDDETCAAVEGATAASYTLSNSDVGSTVVVTVVAHNSARSETATSTQSEVIGVSGPPANTEAPLIRGDAQEGQRLFADNGTWSGSRPLRFLYGWQRCNSAGEACVTIEGASKPSYTATSADIGSTLRLKVTASNALSSTGVLTAATPVVVSSTEASVSEALESAESTDPSVLAPATSTSLEGQTITPAVSDTGEALTAEMTLTPSSVSKETPGEFAVNTADGELSLAPTATSANATKTPTIVNGVAAVFAGTSSQTDTIVRPEPLGATALLQLRTVQAPTSFSWEVRLGAEQKLQQLSNGSVAVIEPASGSYLEGPLGSQGPEEPGSETPAEPGEHPYSGEAAGEELGSSLEEAGQFEALPAAPKTSTSETTPRSGELHPQETQPQYESAAAAVSTAEGQAGGTVLMVIEAPQAMDAAGNTVPASLSVEGNTVTIKLTPGEHTTFPATATLAVAASNKPGPAKGATYGLSDEKTSAFDQSEDDPGHFDPRLTNGPLKVEYARRIVNYDTPLNSIQEKNLVQWVETVEKVETAQKTKLQPTITFRACEPEPPNFPPCPKEPSPKDRALLGFYYNNVILLMRTLVQHGVRVFGAWNEPDKVGNPLHHYSRAAAFIWGEARRAADSKQVNCPACIIVAGEFAAYEPHHLYVENYEQIIVDNERKHDAFPTSRKPVFWGMHDYNDLEDVRAEKSHNKLLLAKNYVNVEKRGFVDQILARGRGTRHVWLSEQGVELESGGGNGTKLTGHPELQRLAAQDFLRLGSPSTGVERVTYYGYKTPPKAERKYEFDSALLLGEGYGAKESEHFRPAYCVLALGESEGCPSKVKTDAPVAHTLAERSGSVLAVVSPEGSPTKYWVEYGTTSGYGSETMPAEVSNIVGDQSETVALTGLQPCTVYHYQAEAENEADVGEPALGGDETLESECKGTARIRLTDVQKEDSGEGGVWLYQEELLEARQGALVFNPRAGCTTYRLEIGPCLELEVESMSREIPEQFEHISGTVVPSHAATKLGARMLASMFGGRFRPEFDINWEAVYEEYPLKAGTGVVRNTWEIEVEWYATVRAPD
jgi:alpha-tubulin suppressor-like RCC1 family protein